MPSPRRLRHSLVAAALLLAAGGTCRADTVVQSDAPVYRGVSQSTRLAARGYDGSGQTVAILDTGVADVAGMGGSVVHQENLSGAPDVGDQFGHGTFVAGLVHSVAPGARIVSVKLAGADGSTDVSQVIAGLEWVIAHRDEYSIDVVNLSFGTDSQQPWQESPLNRAVENVWDAGIVVVASAGNGGPAAGTVTKPADDPLIISVGAMGDAGTIDAGDDTLPSFTSRGPTREGVAKPDLVASGMHVVSLRAPGSTIDVQNPDARVGLTGFRGTGTSFAAPIVAGVTAQLLQARPGLTPDQVKYALTRGADRVAGDTAAQGAGSVRVYDALPYAGVASSNRGVGRSSGKGTIQGARGSFRVRARAQRFTAATVAVSGERMPLVRSATTTTTSSATLATSTDAAADLAPYDTSLLSVDTSGRYWGGRYWGSDDWSGRYWGATEWEAGSWGAAEWWSASWG